MTVQHPSSFRDPSGFVYRDDRGVLLRQINNCYARQYDKLVDSEFYSNLVSENLLIEHEEVDVRRSANGDAYRVIQPRELPFVTYPYEWCFSALKDAAILTLEIQCRALKAGMTLKDASTYNIQFVGTRPIFIDTLSFDLREQGEPWVAYGQFCRHFLAPLALMAYGFRGLNRLSTLYIDGIPLDLISALLPWRTRFRFGLLMHLHLQARMTRRYGDTKGRRQPRSPRVSTQGMFALIENLRKTILRLRWNPGASEWSDYYTNNSYSSAAFQRKKDLVADLIRRAQPQKVWDLGANTGSFSRLASDAGIPTCAFDIEPECTEISYRQGQATHDGFLTPLVLDMGNPSPALGWAHEERQSLADRGPVDLVMVLALIHHITIGNNVPFRKVAEFMHRFARQLIIEFVPKDDPQVKRLLQGRKDIFSDYNRATFEASFAEYFSLDDAQPVGDGGRTLYFMRNRICLS